MPPKDTSKYLSLPEFAEAVDVSRKTVYRWIHSGKITARKNASKDWEIPESEKDKAFNPKALPPRYMRGENGV